MEKLIINIDTEVSYVPEQKDSDNTSHNKAMEQCAHEWLSQSRNVDWCPLCGCLKHSSSISGLADVIIKPRTAP